MDQNQINKSITKSLELRKIILHIAKEAGDKAAHIGGALSCIIFFQQPMKYIKYRVLIP